MIKYLIIFFTIILFTSISIASISNNIPAVNKPIIDIQQPKIKSRCTINIDQLIDSTTEESQRVFGQCLTVFLINNPKCNKVSIEFYFNPNEGLIHLEMTCERRE